MRFPMVSIIPNRVVGSFECCGMGVFIPRQDRSIQSSHLFVELYGLVDHVFVALFEPQVHTPARLDEFL